MNKLFTCLDVPLVCVHCKKNYGIQKMMIDLKYDKGEKQ